MQGDTHQPFLKNTPFKPFHCQIYSYKFITVAGAKTQMKPGSQVFIVAEQPGVGCKQSQ